MAEIDIVNRLGCSFISNFNNGYDNLINKKIGLYQYLLGLQCLHRNRYLHRRVGTNSLSFDEKTDVASVTKLEKCVAVDSTMTFRGNSLKDITINDLLYTSPRVLLNQELYRNRDDIWSFGIMLIYLITGIHPVNKEKILIEDPIRYTYIEMEKLRNEKNFPGIPKDMILDIFNFRSDMDDVINHPWWGDVEFLYYDNPISLEKTMKKYDLNDLKEVIKMVKKYWGTITVEFLFVVMDLFIHHRKDVLTGISCIKIAHLLFQNDIESPINLKTNGYENVIIKERFGNLRTPNIDYKNVFGGNQSDFLKPSEFSLTLNEYSLSVNDFFIKMKTERACVIGYSFLIDKMTDFEDRPAYFLFLAISLYIQFVPFAILKNLKKEDMADLARYSIILAGYEDNMNKQRLSSKYSSIEELIENHGRYFNIVYFRELERDNVKNFYREVMIDIKYGKYTYPLINHKINIDQKTSNKQDNLKISDLIF